MPCRTLRNSWINSQSLSGSRPFDLSSAFWQLPLAEESREWSVFMTKTHGLLRWKALPLGFKNSSACFQRAIDAALGTFHLLIDDVVVHSKGSFEDHVAKVQAALRALRVVGFSGNPAKCKFAQREVFFLVTEWRKARQGKSNA